MYTASKELILRVSFAASAGARPRLAGGGTRRGGGCWAGASWRWTPARPPPPGWRPPRSTARAPPDTPHNH